uniref:Uncharacterized protein n=1 Tax=Glossina austeni TaxID=7395 RepID=A0A1A9UDM3_GLOAU
LKPSAICHESWLLLDDALCSFEKRNIDLAGILVLTARQSILDIRELIHNRKQRVNEKFDTYYDDTLDVPILRVELVEVLKRNLHPEICHELLHFDVRCTANLRKFILGYEISEEELNRSKSFKHSIHRRSVIIEPLIEKVFNGFPSNF